MSNVKRYTPTNRMLEVEFYARPENIKVYINESDYESLEQENKRLREAMKEIVRVSQLKPIDEAQLIIALEALGE